jgi:CRISPR-associated protein Csd2
MWDLDHSAGRGLLACRGLYVFTHENRLGNAPAHALIERISAHLVNRERPPRCFADYRVALDEVDLPVGVSLTRLVGCKGRFGIRTVPRTTKFSWQ